MEQFVIPLWADLLAVALGGVQAALFASERREERDLDLLGVATIGVVVGMGGGLIRDLLLNRLPATLQSNWYLLVAAGAALLGMLLAKPLHRFASSIVALDALVLGLFGAFGATKALGMGVPPVPAAFVGVCSAVGGGMVRDLLVGAPVTVLYTGSLYGVAAGAGCTALVVARELGAPTGSAALLGIVVAVTVRMTSVRFGVTLPGQRTLDLRRRGPGEAP